MEIIRLVQEKTLLISEKILSALENGFCFQEFESQLKVELDELGVSLLKVVLESLDQQLRRCPQRKQEWNIVRRNDLKEILTHFGQLSYERTYYRRKGSGEYSHLVDDKAGITPHSRISTNMKAELTEACGETSYEQATRGLSRHNPALKVSKQTAGNCVKSFQPKPLVPLAEKRQVKTLYIEADEDHLKIKKRRAEARLVYFHEGVVGTKRRHLVNARYLTTTQKKPGEFWFEVLDNLDAYYDLDYVKDIYLSGDGASWIKTGHEHIPGSVLILDKFHLAKAIVVATTHARELRRQIYQGIWRGDIRQVMECLNEALELATSRSSEERILASITYIRNNWESIQNGVKYPEVGCSAEGHVSHILSARLSSRPMAWSQQGAENMAAIRAVRANGESVKDHYIAMSPPAPVIVELEQQVKKEIKRVKRMRNAGREALNNVPIYSGGSSYAREALKGLNSRTAV